MDISNLYAARSFTRRIEQDVNDLRRDLASGESVDSANIAGLLDRIEQSARLAGGSIESVDASLRNLLGH